MFMLYRKLSMMPWLDLHAFHMAWRTPHAAMFAVVLRLCEHLCTHIHVCTQIIEDNVGT